MAVTTDLLIFTVEPVAISSFWIWLIIVFMILTSKSSIDLGASWKAS